MKKKSILSFDQLHRFDDYFEPMVLSDDSKKTRRELAEFLTDAFLYFFAIFEVHMMHDSLLDQAFYEQLLADRISDAVSKVTGIDGEMSGHIRTLAREVVETTFKNAQKKKTRSEPDDGESQESSPLSSRGSSSPLTETPEETREREDIEEEEDVLDDMLEGPWKLNLEDPIDYWLSLNRASDIAYSEANTFFNYTDYVEAKKRGYTQKTWHTMLDPKVRTTHEEIEGETIGIDELFQVGDSQMRFPHDWEYSPNPKEVVNCRCAVDYK